MNYADFSGADLRGATFFALNAEGLIFHKAVLSSATMDGMLLSGVDFSNVDLRDITIRKATLENINLSGSDLRGANLTTVYLPKLPDFIGASNELSRCNCPYFKK